MCLELFWALSSNISFYSQGSLVKFNMVIISPFIDGKTESWDNITSKWQSKVLSTASLVSLVSTLKAQYLPSKCTQTIDTVGTCLSTCCSHQEPCSYSMVSSHFIYPHTEAVHERGSSTEKPNFRLRSQEPWEREWAEGSLCLSLPIFWSAVVRFSLSSAYQQSSTLTYLPYKLPPEKMHWLNFHII